MKKLKIEAQNIEFKTNWRDEYMNAICAFANTVGRVLLLGRDEAGKTNFYDG